MEQKYLSDDVFEQIKDFDRYKLTEEQKLLIDELILNEELKCISKYFFNEVIICYFPYFNLIYFFYNLFNIFS